MGLLVLYFSLAIGVSFLCSILEAVLLSVNVSYISVLEKEKPKVGKLLKTLKTDMNKSIASILVLNTVANTLGAAGVGAQAGRIFDSSFVFYVSVALVFSILFFSEIIPKTIGALYWRKLAPMSAYFIKFFLYITYPIVLMTLFVTNRISKGKEDVYALTRAELLESTFLSEDEGIIDQKESDVIENVLHMEQIKVKEILTPKTVMFAVDGSKKVKDILSEKDVFSFSRMPVYDGTIDNVTGLVLAKKLFLQAFKNNNITIDEIKKDIFKINENIPVPKVLDLFIKKKDHMFLVVDGYDQTEGIVTLEDCIETLLGVEIVDESDNVEDMRQLAKQKIRLKQKGK
ncbi:MAG: DUF21 domain-containing protein [Planctomycetes bacterium]|nr:DUF21 domain-containing protein [Planctomycetota bacterium]